jgi:hypothetical protein
MQKIYRYFIYISWKKKTNKKELNAIIIIIRIYLILEILK